jgi:hypothetical protein
VIVRKKNLSLTLAGYLLLPGQNISENILCIRLVLDNKVKTGENLILLDLLGIQFPLSYKLL